MKDKIDQIIQQAIKDQIFPGACVGIVTKAGERFTLPFGTFFGEGSQDITEDSIFDVASITKSVVTSSLALKLLDEGKLHISDKVADYVPELSNSYKNEITVFHLLTHTLDFGFRLSSLKDKEPDAILKALYSSELKAPPGTTFFYSNATSILLGIVVSRVFESHTLKGDIAFQADRLFFTPLEMTRTCFNPLDRFSKDEIVPTEIDTWRDETIQGVVHDESAFTLQKEMYVGSAGLFSTVPDLLHFVEMLLHEGEFHGTRYFSTDIIKQIHTNQITSLGLYAGLGWELAQARYMGDYASRHCFGKTGFTGCVMMIDPMREKGLVFLSNYTFPKRKQSADIINEVRRGIADIIFR
ncbi:serine hydrolase domain-containing protein [Candidatus Margulisiibacteriota bacterium]